MTELSRTSSLLALLAALTLAPSALASPAGAAADATSGQSASALAGSWLGQLAVGPLKLRLVLHVTRQADGSWAATMDSPDQGQFGLLFEHVTVAGDQLSVTSEKLHGGFTGRLVGGHLEGTWQQGPGKLALVLEPGTATVVAKPQEPRPPYPYEVEDVRYPNIRDDVTLAGTLTRPHGHGPFPAVVLIPGSGQHGRDCMIFGHKPFKLWADALTRRGVAVLRVDDRGMGGSTGDFAMVTSAALARDVEAGLDYLRSRRDIARVGLVGHSEGGMIAPMVAAERPDVAFVVTLAGPGLPGDRIIVDQVGLLSQAAGMPAAEVEQAKALQARVLDVVKADLADAVARERLRALLLPAGATAEQQAQVEGTIDKLLSPWYRFFVRGDPRAYLARVKCPVLAVNGERDLQVEAGPNLAAIRETLEAHGNHAVTTLALPHLNHLLQTCRTGLVQEYGQLDETVAPAALNAVGEWIEHRALARPEHRG